VKTVRGKWTGGPRIKQLCTDLGLKRVDFATSLEISYDRLLAYISGKTEPSPEFFRKLVEVYPEVDLQWLIAGVAGQSNAEYKIPIVDSIQAGSLTPSIQGDQVRGYWTPRNQEEGLFGLEVRGNSMYPEIQDGDIAICSPSEPFLSGHIYAVGTKDYSYTLKRLFKRTGGYDLVPSNPDHLSVFVAQEDLLQIVRVVELVRTLS
jgi:repressor LexA